MRLVPLAIPLAAALAVLAACSPGGGESATAPAPQASGPAHPVSGLPVIDLAVHAAKGVHHFRVELARTEEEQARGLMFRTQMGADEGMLFPRDPPRFASFWMKNTVIPLDLLFVGKDGRVLNIAANAEPYSERSLFSAAPAMAVLELNGGRAAQLGIAPGDRVVW